MCIFQEGESMIKKLFVFILGMCLLGITQNAEAVVAQSAMKAMSYKNTVRRSIKKTEPVVKQEKKQDVIPYKRTTVDLRGGASKSVKLIEQEELEIKVKEIDGYTWSVSYDSDNLIMIGNSAEGGVRTVKLKQRGVEDSSVFLDKRDSSGNTVENKAVYIKVH